MSFWKQQTSRKPRLRAGAKFNARRTAPKTTAELQTISFDNALIDTKTAIYTSLTYDIYVRIRGE